MAKSLEINVLKRPHIGSTRAYALLWIDIYPEPSQLMMMMMMMMKREKEE